jgi:prepilin-type processing-associated H-X9-DG protein
MLVPTEFTPATSLIGGVMIGIAAVMLMALDGRVAGIGHPLAKGPTDITPTVAVPRPAGSTGTWRPGSDAVYSKKFGSWHTGVCQFAFGDGSVKAISTSIDEVNLGRLAARNDGEVISANY